MSMSTPLPLSNPLNELREGTNGTPDTFSSFVSGCATPNHPNRARVLPSPPPTSVGEIGASPLHTSRPESPSGLGRSTHKPEQRVDACVRAISGAFAPPDRPVPLDSSNGTNALDYTTTQPEVALAGPDSTLFDDAESMLPYDLDRQPEPDDFHLDNTAVIMIYPNKHRGLGLKASELPTVDPQAPFVMDPTYRSVVNGSAPMHKLAAQLEGYHLQARDRVHRPQPIEPGPIKAKAVKPGFGPGSNFATEAALSGVGGASGGSRGPLRATAVLPTSSISTRRTGADNCPSEERHTLQGSILDRGLAVAKAAKAQQLAAKVCLLADQALAARESCPSEAQSVPPCHDVMNLDSSSANSTQEDQNSTPEIDIDAQEMPIDREVSPGLTARTPADLGACTECEVHLSAAYDARFAPAPDDAMRGDPCAETKGADATPELLPGQENPPGSAGRLCTEQAARLEREAALWAAYDALDTSAAEDAARSDPSAEFESPDAHWMEFLDPDGELIWSRLCFGEPERQPEAKGSANDDDTASHAATAMTERQDLRGFGNTVSLAAGEDQEMAAEAQESQAGWVELAAVNKAVLRFSDAVEGGEMGDDDLLNIDAQNFLERSLNPNGVVRGRVIERLWNYLTSLFKILNCPRANGHAVSLEVLSVKELYFTAMILEQVKEDYERGCGNANLSYALQRAGFTPMSWQVDGEIATVMSLAINALAPTLSQLAELVLGARVFSENMASRVKSVAELLVEHRHLAQAYEEEGEETPRSRSTSSKVRALEAAHGTLGLALKYFTDDASTKIFDYERRLQEMCDTFTMAIKTLKGMNLSAFRALFPSPDVDPANLCMFHQLMCDAGTQLTALTRSFASLATWARALLSIPDGEEILRVVTFDYLLAHCPALPMELRSEVGGLLEVTPPRPLIDGAMDGVAAVAAGDAHLRDPRLGAASWQQPDCGGTYPPPSSPAEIAHGASERMMVDIAAAATQAQEEREAQEADDMSFPLDMLLELWVGLQGDPQSETTATVSDELGGFPISDDGITAFMDHHESLVANPAVGSPWSSPPMSPDVTDMVEAEPFRNLLSSDSVSEMDNDTGSEAGYSRCVRQRTVSERALSNNPSTHLESQSLSAVLAARHDRLTSTSGRAGKSAVTWVTPPAAAATSPAALSLSAETVQQTMHALELSPSAESQHDMHALELSPSAESQHEGEPNFSTIAPSTGQVFFHERPISARVSYTSGSLPRPPNAGADLPRSSMLLYTHMIEACASEPAVPSSEELAAVLALAEARASSDGFIPIGRRTKEGDTSNLVAGPPREADTLTDAPPATKAQRCRPKTPPPMRPSSPQSYFNDAWMPPGEGEQAADTPPKTEPQKQEDDTDALSPTAWMTPDAPASEPTAPSAPVVVNRDAPPAHPVRRRRLGWEEVSDDVCRAEPTSNAERICFDYTLGRACKPECSYYGWRHACQNCRRGCAFGEGRYECSKCAESPPLEVAPAEPSGSTSDEPRLPSSTATVSPDEPEGETPTAPEEPIPMKGQSQDFRSRRGEPRPRPIDLSPFVRAEGAEGRSPRYTTLSKNNLEAVLNDEKGARCYHCLGSPCIDAEVETCDPPRYDTICCPLCGVDAVIAASQLPDEPTLHAWHWLAFIANRNDSPPSNPSIKAKSDGSTQSDPRSLSKEDWPSLADGPGATHKHHSADDNGRLSPAEKRIRDGLAQCDLGPKPTHESHPVEFSASGQGPKAFSEISAGTNPVNPAAYVDARPTRISFHSEANGATVVVIAGSTIPVEQGGNGLRAGQEVVVDASRSNVGTVATASPTESVWDAPHWRTNKPQYSLPNFWRQPVGGHFPASGGRTGARAAARGKALSQATSNTAAPQRCDAAARAGAGRRVQPVHATRPASLEDPALYRWFFGRATLLDDRTGFIDEAAPSKGKQYSFEYDRAQGFKPSRPADQVTPRLQERFWVAYRLDPKAHPGRALSVVRLLPPEEGSTLMQPAHKPPPAKGNYGLPLVSLYGWLPSFKDLLSVFNGSTKTHDITDGAIDSRLPRAVVTKVTPRPSEVVTDGSGGLHGAGNCDGAGEVCGERGATLVDGLVATKFPSSFEAGPELQYLGRYARVYQSGLSDPEGIEADPADLSRAGLIFKREYCVLLNQLLGRVPEELYLEIDLKGIYFVGGLRLRGVSEKAIALPSAGVILVDLKWLVRELEATTGESRSRMLTFKAGRVLHEIAHLCDYKADPQGWRGVDPMLEPLLDGLQFPARGSGMLPDVNDRTRESLPNRMLYAAMAPEEFRAEWLADLWLIGDLSAAKYPQRLAWAYWRARSKTSLPGLNKVLRGGFRDSHDAPDLPIWAQRALFAYKMGDYVEMTPLGTALQELKDTLTYAEASTFVRQGSPPLGSNAKRWRWANACASEPHGSAEAPSETADPPLWLARMRQQLAEAENGPPSLGVTRPELDESPRGSDILAQLEAELDAKWGGGAASAVRESSLGAAGIPEGTGVTAAAASFTTTQSDPREGLFSVTEPQKENHDPERSEARRVVAAAAARRAAPISVDGHSEDDVRRGPVRLGGKSKYASYNWRDSARPYAADSDKSRGYTSYEAKMGRGDRWRSPIASEGRGGQQARALPPAAMLDNLERGYAATLRRPPDEGSSAEISILFDIKGEHCGQHSRLWVDLNEQASIILYKVVLHAVGHVSRNMMGWKLVGGRCCITFDTDCSGRQAGLHDGSRYSLVSRLRGGSDELPLEGDLQMEQQRWLEEEPDDTPSPLGQVPDTGAERGDAAEHGGQGVDTMAFGPPYRPMEDAEEAQAAPAAPMPPTPIPVHRQPGEILTPAEPTPEAHPGTATSASPRPRAAAEASEAGPSGAGVPASWHPGSTSYSPLDAERLRQERSRRAELEAARLAEAALEQQRLAEEEASRLAEEAREQQRLADQEVQRLADLAIEQRIEKAVQSRVQKKVESQKRGMEAKVEELVDLEMRKRLSRVAAHAMDRSEASISGGSPEAPSSGGEAAVGTAAALDPEELDVGPLDPVASRPSRSVDFGSPPHSQQADRRSEEQSVSHPPRPRSERAPGTEPRWHHFQSNEPESRWDDGPVVPSRQASARSPSPPSPPFGDRAPGHGRPGPASTAATTARAARRGATGSTFSMPDDPNQAEEDLSFWEQEESATFTDAPSESTLRRYCERHNVAPEVQELIETVRRLPWQANTVSPHTNCFNPNLERPPLRQKQSSAKKLSETHIAQKDFKFFSDPKLTASTEADQLNAWVKVRAELCITLRTCVDTRCSGAEFLPAIRDELNRLLGHTQALPQLAALIVQGLQTFVTLASNCLLLACDLHFCPEYSSLTALQTVRRMPGQSLVDLFAHVELLHLQSKNKEQEGRDYIYDELRLTDRQAIPDLHRYTVKAVAAGDQPWAAEVAVALDRACTNARAYARTVNEKDRAAVLQLQAIAFNAGIIGLDQNLSLAYKNNGHNAYADYEHEEAQYPPRQTRTRGARTRNTVAPVTTRSAGQPPRTPPQLPPPTSSYPRAAPQPPLPQQPPLPPPPPPLPPQQQQYLKPLDHVGRSTERPSGHSQAEPRKGTGNPGNNPNATTTNLWIDMAEARRAAEEPDSERKRLAVMIWPSDDCARFAADVECKATPVFENDGRPAYFNDGRPMVSFNHKRACRFCSVWAARNLEEWKSWPHEVQEGQHNPKVCPRSIAALLKAGNPGASFLKERWGKKPTRPEGQRRPGQ